MRKGEPIRISKNKGFTIIEVLIAIVIMSILCFPIFGYFRSSSQVNALSKRKQKATLAAQSVMEEVVAYGSSESYIDMCKAVNPENSNKSYRIVNYPADDFSEQIYTFSRPVEIDGSPFIAYIQMNYDEYKSVGTSTVGTMYNSYNNPLPKSLDTTKSVVAIERSQNAGAISHFTSMGASETDVRSNMVRTAILTLSEVSTDANEVSTNKIYVKMIYKYEFNSQVFISPDTLYDGTMDKEVFDNVYWFYTSLSATKDNLEVVDQLETVGKNYSLTIVRQEPNPLDPDGSVNVGIDYKVDVKGLDVINGINRINAVYSNVQVTGVSVSKELVNMEEVKRISKVSVSVFPNGTVNFGDLSKALVTVESAKGD